MVVLPGPGNSLGGICGQLIVAEGYPRPAQPSDFEHAQQSGTPVVLSMRRRDAGRSGRPGRGPDATPDAQVVVEPATPIDLPTSLAPLAHGRGDPTIRLEPWGAWRATRTPDGPGHACGWWRAAPTITVSAWGPGAGWVTSNAAAWSAPTIGRRRSSPGTRSLAELVHRLPGLRLPRQPAPLRCPAAGHLRAEGHRRRGAGRVPRHRPRATASRRPGRAGCACPRIRRCWRRCPSYAFHRLGIERRRAELIRHCARARPPPGRDAARAGGSAPARRAGIGPWTIAEVARVA